MFSAFKRVLIFWVGVGFNNFFYLVKAGGVKEESAAEGQPADVVPCILDPFRGRRMRGEKLL